MSSVISRQTINNASATQSGLIAASGAQILAPALTLNSDVNVSSGSTTAMKINGGGYLSFASIGSTIVLSGGGSTSVWKIWDGFSNYMVIDNTANTAAMFPSNVGFNFSATLTPVINTQAVDWASGTSKIVSATSTTATLVLTFVNPVVGGRYIIETVGKTGRAWTFPNTVKWAGGVAPTVTAVDAAIDMFQFVYDGAIYVGSIIAQNVS